MLLIILSLYNHYSVLTIVYNIQIQSLCFRHCPSRNRYTNTETLCFGSRLCFSLRWSYS